MNYCPHCNPCTRGGGEKCRAPEPAQAAPDVHCGGCGADVVTPALRDELARLRAVEQLYEAGCKTWTPVLNAMQIRAERAEAELAAARADAEAMIACLPGPYYMDPPDGGDVSPVEQMRRMAKDAARYRAIRHVESDCSHADFDEHMERIYELDAAREGSQ